MDNTNNKLEEFFNQSLNQFDDSPSDAVWVGLEQRLDSERTLLEKCTHFIRSYFPYLLLLLGLGTYHLFAQSKINRLSENIELITSENSALGLQLEDCGNETNTLLTNLNAQTTELENKTVDIANLEGNIKTAENLIAQLKRKNYSNRQTIRSLQNPILNTRQENTFTQNNVSIDSDIKTPRFKDAFISILNDPNKIVNTNTNSKDQSNKNTLKSIAARRSKNMTTSIGYTNIQMISMLPINPITPVEKSRFRIGLNQRAYHTFPNTSDEYNFSLSEGLIMEFPIGNKLYLTGAVNANFQNYQVYNNGNNIPLKDLLKYPSGTSFGDQVTKISVASQYLDFPLGIKFHLFTFKKRDTDLYINPSVVWQIYLNQRFKYTIANNTKQDVFNRQKYGYFGSGKLKIGFETKLGKNFIYQSGFWAERSFIPLGIEDQNIMMVGINGSILFQGRKK